MSNPNEVSVTKLSRGPLVVSEEMAGSKSVSVGIWVGVGSRDESERYWGCSHFLEHLLFKGTTRRSAKEISTVIEERGGYLNAFTDRDMTCFHSKVLGADLPLAVDVLSDMVQNPLLKTEDVDMERTVVFSEIDSRDDDPSDLINDLYFETTWGSNSAAHPILGERSDLQGLDSANVRGYFKDHYVPSEMIVTAAGKVDHDKLVELTEKHMFEAGAASKKTRVKPVFKPVRNYVDRKSSQVQVALTTEGTPYGEETRDSMQIISSYLGVGASSKLFQEIREKRGLVYSIYSTNYSLGDSGLFTILAGTQDKFVEKLLRVGLKELSVLGNAFTQSRLERIKHKTIGLTTLRSESSESRMIQLGASTLRRGKPKTLTETIDGLKGVTGASIAECIEGRFDKDALSLTTLGLSKETGEKIEALF